MVEQSTWVNHMAVSKFGGSLACCSEVQYFPPIEESESKHDEGKFKKSRLATHASIKRLIYWPFISAVTSAIAEMALAPTTQLACTQTHEDCEQFRQSWIWRHLS